MTVKITKVVVHKRAVRQIMKYDPKLRADIERRLAAMKSRAQSRDPSGKYHVEVGQTSERMRGVIVTANRQAQEAEATDRTLSNSFDAGRE